MYRDLIDGAVCQLKNVMVIAPGGQKGVTLALLATRAHEVLGKGEQRF